MILAQARVNGYGVEEGLGINAEVAYMAQCLGQDRVDVMGVTGTAFRAHFFAPELNPGMADPPPWAWSSLRYNNYGHHESAAYYFGGEVIPVLDRTAVQNWKLLRFEIDAGRPAIVYGLDPHPARPVLVVGYALHKAPLAQFLTLVDGREIEVTGDVLGATEIILVRQGAQVPYRPSDEERRADMFRWVAGHVRTSKELIYETSRFYATGASALEKAAAFSGGAEGDAVGFLVAWAAEYTRARQAALEFVGRHHVRLTEVLSEVLAAAVAAEALLASGDPQDGRAAGQLERAAAAERKWGAALLAATAT